MRAKNVRSPYNAHTKFPKAYVRKFFSETLSINLLLHAASYGDLITVEKILTKYPNLLSARGDVKDAAGNLLEDVTVLQCAIIVGDAEMSVKLKNYFGKLTKVDGKKELYRQCLPYQTAIKNMSEGIGDYDYSLLLDELFKSPIKDVKAELDIHSKDYSDRPKTLLRTELDNFRAHFSPRVIEKGQMSFNHQNVIEAYRLYINYWIDKTKLERGDDILERFHLFLCQIIGYIHRSLPAIERQAFAQGITSILKEEAPLNRSYDMVDGKFPTADELPHSLLGYEYAVIDLGLKWSERDSFPSKCIEKIAKKNAEKGLPTINGEFNYGMCRLILDNYRELYAYKVETFKAMFNTLQFNLKRVPEDDSVIEKKSRVC
ncbi:TPA: hypothetical protein ACX87D_000022 [Legionella pneumophila]